MTGGVVAAALVAHVPTLGLAKNTPDYQQTLVQAEQLLGAAMRERLKPDLWVIVSTHWISTFDWFATCQPMHEGLCVADEAPNLIPGIPYRYRGDPDFGAALVDTWNQSGVVGVRNESPNYHWDYGTFVPLQYLDPKGDVPVVGLPVVLMADHGECLRAGAAVHAAAKQTGKRVVFLASTALHQPCAGGRTADPAADADKRRRSAETRRHRRGHRELHRVQQEDRRRDGRPRARHDARCRDRDVARRKADRGDPVRRVCAILGQLQRGAAHRGSGHARQDACRAGGIGRSRNGGGMSERGEAQERSSRPRAIEGGRRPAD
jgi:hypothetical protein